MESHRAAWEGALGRRGEGEVEGCCCCCRWFFEAAARRPRRSEWPRDDDGSDAASCGLEQVFSSSFFAARGSSLTISATRARARRSLSGRKGRNLRGEGYVRERKVSQNAAIARCSRSPFSHSFPRAWRSLFPLFLTSPFVLVCFSQSSWFVRRKKKVQLAVLCRRSRSSRRRSGGCWFQLLFEKEKRREKNNEVSNRSSHFTRREKKEEERRKNPSLSFSLSFFSSFSRRAERPGRALARRPPRLVAGARAESQERERERQTRIENEFSTFRSRPAVFFFDLDLDPKKAKKTQKNQKK